MHDLPYPLTIRSHFAPLSIHTLASGNQKSDPLAKITFIYVNQYYYRQKQRTANANISISLSQLTNTAHNQVLLNHIYLSAEV